MLIEVVVSGLLAATPVAVAGPRPTATLTASAATTNNSSSCTAAVSWAELRESIGACICVEPFTHEETEYFVPQVGRCERCEAPATETALSSAVESAYEAALPVLISLNAPGLEEASRPGPGLPLDERTRLTRRTYLDWDPFLRLLLEHLRAALADAGLSCPDCPSFDPQPVRHVAWSEFLPYLAAHVWPDPVVTPTGAGESPAEEPRYGFHVCAGLNGVAEMTDPDPHLVQAAFLGAFHTEEVRERAWAHFEKILEEEPFINLDGDEDRTRYLRRRLPEEITRDAAVKTAVCRTLDGLATDIGLVVDGCEETKAVAEKSLPRS